MATPLQWITRTPLLLKLITLDAVVNVFALLVMQWVPPSIAEPVMLLSLFGVLVLNAALVAWALRPLQLLENTARRVSGGELTARVAMPTLTDVNLLRIGTSWNELLDRLAAERDRVRHLAGLVVAAGDAERARIARELHDGTAQSLSALDMLLASTVAEGHTAAIVERLQVMRRIVGDALAEVRGMAQGMHPRVLDDLGLVAALEQLARLASVGRTMEVVVHADPQVRLPAASSAVLFRVAQEAVHNAIKHSEAGRVDVRLVARGAHAEVRVHDDGRGFDLDEASNGRRGMGLFVMQERVLLAEGTFAITTALGRGTTVVARIPLLESP